MRLERVVKGVAPPDDPMAAMVLNALGQVKTGAMLKGLDQTRGFGLAVTLPKNPAAGEPPSVVAGVPVSNLAQFLDSLKDLGLAVDDQPGVPGFSHKVTMPGGSPTLFVLQSKEYALFSLVPVGADRIRAIDPASWKPKGRPETALSTTIRLSEPPRCHQGSVPDPVPGQCQQVERARTRRKRQRVQGPHRRPEGQHRCRQEPDSGWR